MKGSLFLLLALCCLGAQCAVEVEESGGPVCCFENIGGIPPEDSGFYHTVGNIVLSQRNKVVLTDPDLLQDENTSVILDVSVSVWGEDVCVSLIDCGAFNPEEQRLEQTVTVTAFNADTGAQLDFTAHHIPGNANRGVYFGCVHTERVDGSYPAGEAIAGDFGHELRIVYTPEVGDTCYFPVWPSCKETEHWSYGEITCLMAQDVIGRNINKLRNLKKKVEYLQELLLGDEEPYCQDWARVKDLAPLSLSSFEFLEALNTRHINAVNFLDYVNEQNSIVEPMYDR